MSSDEGRDDDDIDTSEIPPLGPDFFQNATLTRPGEWPLAVTFYLTRNTALRGAGYNLSNYAPKAPPNERDFLTWWFWEDGVHMILRTDVAQKLEAQAGQQLQPGESLNLTTGQIVRIEDAPRIKGQP